MPIIGKAKAVYARYPALYKYVSALLGAFVMKSVFIEKASFQSTRWILFFIGKAGIFSEAIESLDPV